MAWQRHPQYYKPNMWKCLVGSKAEVQHCNTWLVMEDFCLALFFGESSFKMQFVEKYDSESPGQGIRAVTPCQISYHKNTVKPILSPVVPYKCCAMSSGQVQSLMDEWIPNSHEYIACMYTILCTGV